MHDTSVQKDGNEEPEALIGSSSSIRYLESTESTDLGHGTGWIGGGESSGIRLVQTSPLDIGDLSEQEEESDAIDEARECRGGKAKEDRGERRE